MKNYNTESTFTHLKKLKRRKMSKSELKIAQEKLKAQGYTGSILEKKV